MHALAHAPTHLDRGQVIAASRDTPAGRLDWQITVRDDGRVPFDGVGPLVISWDSTPPTPPFPPSPPVAATMR